MKITNSGTSEGAKEGWRTRNGENGFEKAHRIHTEAQSAVEGLNDVPSLRAHQNHHEDEYHKAENRAISLAGKGWTEDVLRDRKEAWDMGNYHKAMADAATEKLRKNFGLGVPTTQYALYVDQLRRSRERHANG